MSEITYRVGNEMTVDQVIELYSSTTLGARRPIDDRGAMEEMMRNSNMIIAAWDQKKLVGLARSLTDFRFVCYLSDLAVRDSYQRQGIGRELIAQMRYFLGPKCNIVLLAAPQAVDYYPRLGFTQHPSAWTLDAQNPLL